jgi:hypothetical protein
MKTWDKASLGPFDAGGGHKTERPDLGDCSGKCEKLKLGQKFVT